MYAHLGVAGVGDVNAIAAADGDAGRRVERATDGRDHAVAIDPPDPVVIGIGNDSSSGGVDRNAYGCVEAGLRSGSIDVARNTVTGDRGDVAISCNPTDRVVTSVCYIQCSARIERQSRDGCEPRCRTGTVDESHATPGDIDDATVRCNGADTWHVGPVSDEDGSIGTDRHAEWIVEAGGGHRSAASADDSI